MDDDFSFGASVWATPDPKDSPASPKEAESTTTTTTDATSTAVIIGKRKPPAPLALDDDLADDGAFDNTPTPAATFDDNDDDFGDDAFGAPADASAFDAQGGGDDDFGDFGDFEDFEEAGTAAAPVSAFEDVEFDQGPAAMAMSFGAGPSSRPWRPIQVDTDSSLEEIREEVYAVLDPIWDGEEIERVTTDVPMREVEGVGQILVNSSSRHMYKMLLQPPSSSKPTNWTRSRIRRQHLISLGIPVNLDEVLPKANGRALPMLEVHTRPMSAPPERGFRNPAGGSNHPSRSGTPQPQGPQSNLVAQFGPKPELDISKIKRLLDMDAEYLALQPLPNLERMLNEMRLHTAHTSNLLTYLLQSRDALQQDSETYNGLIANLVSEMAQKVKSGKPGKPVSRSMSRHGR